jgi:hypothetical protein
MIRARTVCDEGPSSKVQVVESLELEFAYVFAEREPPPQSYA